MLRRGSPGGRSLRPRGAHLRTERLGHRVPGMDVLGLLAGDLRPEMVEVVRRCAASFKTGLLTNNITAMPGGTELDGVIGLFDTVVESSVVGIRKPDPAFYELACTRLQIEPAEAVFLDDLGINLKPAAAMGMTTIKVSDPRLAIEELQSAIGINLR